MREEREGPTSQEPLTTANRAGQLWARVASVEAGPQGEETGPRDPKQLIFHGTNTLEEVILPPRVRDTVRVAACGRASQWEMSNTRLRAGPGRVCRCRGGAGLTYRMVRPPPLALQLFPVLPSVPPWPHLRIPSVFRLGSRSLLWQRRKGQGGLQGRGGQGRDGARAGVCHAVLNVTFGRRSPG